MTSRKSHVPKYRHYRPKDLAVVRIDGRDIYLGKYGSPQSKEKYARLIADRFSSAGKASSVCLTENQGGLTVNELILRYWSERVIPYYQKDGKPTDRRTHHIRAAFRPLRHLFGSSPANCFGPLALQQVREEIIRDGAERRGKLNRGYVNDHIGIIKRLFRWAVSQEIVEANVHSALLSLENIHKGRDARLSESVKIHPAPRSDVQAVLRHVSPQIRAMIQL